MKLRQQAAQILGDTLASTVQLANKPTVIDSPPSDVGDYPALAIWIERSKLHITNDGDVQVISGTGNSPGNPPQLIAGINASDVTALAPGLFPSPQSSTTPYLPGADPTLELFAQGDLAQLAPGVAVSHVGTIRCVGRLFAGARYAPKREDLEEHIFFAFFADRTAPGRLMLPLAGAKLGRYTLAWGYAAAVLDVDEDNEWTNEMAFEQRLWSWTHFSLDVPLLVPRYEPIVKQFLLYMSQDVDATVASTTQMLDLPDLEEYQVASDGSVTPP